MDRTATAPGRGIQTRAFYLACAAAAGAGLAVIGLQAADVLSIGPRPDPSALQDFLLSLALGVVLGVCFMSYQAHLYRNHRDFFVAFRAASLRERLRWQFQRWILLASLPVWIGGEIAVIVLFWRELRPLPVWLGICLCLPLVAGPWAEVNALAREHRSSRDASAMTPRPLANLWGSRMTPGQYARLASLWLALAATLAVAGYTMTFRHREEREEGRGLVAALLRHGLAGQDRFYKATDLCRKATRSCDLGRVAAAEASSREILRVADEFTYDWNYGNAIHYGNLVLGRLALARGDLREAKRGLLRAGLTPGSPQLGDYGPDMTLARDLLIHGETRTVLRYFSLCNRFWMNPNRNCIETWADDVRTGQVPEFGSWAGPMPMPEKGWTCEVIEGGLQQP